MGVLCALSLSLVVSGAALQPAAAFDATNYAKALPAIGAGATAVRTAGLAVVGTGAIAGGSGGVVAGGASACAIANIGCPVLAVAAVGVIAVVGGGYLLLNWGEDHVPNRDVTSVPDYDWIVSPANAVLYAGESRPDLRAFSVKVPDSFSTQFINIRFRYYRNGVKVNTDSGNGNLLQPNQKWLDALPVVNSWSVGRAGQWPDPVHGVTGHAVDFQGLETAEPVVVWGQVPVQWTPPPLPELDPLRRMRSETRCVTYGDLPAWTSGNTTVGRLQSALSDTYTETSPAPATVPVPACNPGEVAVDFESKQQTKTGDQWITENHKTINITPDKTLWDPTVQGAECVPGGSSYPCLLEIQKRVPDETGTKRWLSCHSGTVACTEWDTHTQAELQDNPDYRCQYGPNTVAMSNCFQTYPPGPKPKPDENTFPNPQPDPTTPEASGCAPDGWSVLNPLAYVKATGCLLQWAFVPTTTTTTRVAEIRDTLTTRPPGSVVVGGVSGVVALWDNYNGGTCTAADSPDFSYLPGTPLRIPCTPPLGSHYDALLLLMKSGLWLGTGWGIWRMSERAFGG